MATCSACVLVRCEQVPDHQPVFMNEPRLLEFKLLLLKEGIQAEFSAGVLICNNCVAIKKVPLLSATLRTVATNLRIMCA